MNTIPFHADFIGAEDFVDRGPLPEVSESDWVAFDLARNANKGERLARQNDARALADQMAQLDVLRRVGAI